MFWNQRYSITLLILFVKLLAVTAKREDRSGASFFPVSPISLGFTQWNILSFLDTNQLAQGLQELHKDREIIKTGIKNFQKQDAKQAWKISLTYRKKLEKARKIKDPQARTKFISHLNAKEEDRTVNILNPVLQKTVKVNNTEEEYYQGFFEKILQELDTYVEAANEIYENLAVFIGNSDEKRKKRKKRSVSDILSVGYQLGKDLYQVYKTSEESEKIRLLVQRYNSTMQKQGTSIQTLRTFADQQVSFNRDAIEKWTEIESDIANVTEEIEDFKNTIASKRLLTELARKLIRKYKSFIMFADEVMKAMIKGTRGKPHPPFLSPTVVQNISVSLAKEPELSKSIYKKDQTLELYNTVKTTIEVTDGNVGIINTVRIPTSTSTGTLHRIITYPIYIKEDDRYIEVEVKYPYIVTNDESDYVRFSDADVNACEKLSTIMLCGSENILWQKRHIPTCESALFFGDIKNIETFCNFRTLPKEPVKVKQIASGLFHYAISEITSVPVKCKGKAKDESGNRNLIDNGFITISPLCTASIATKYGTRTLKNLLVDRHEAFENKPDPTTFNVSRIQILKENYLEEKIRQMNDSEPLTNEEILENISNQKKKSQRQQYIQDLEDLHLKLAESQMKIAQEHNENTDKHLKQLQEISSDNDTFDIIGYVLCVFGFGALLLFMALILGFYKRKADFQSFLSQSA